MPKWKIESTAQVRRIYIIDAPSADAAEEIVAEDNPGLYLAQEEDISEEIDSVDEYIEPKLKRTA